jgi:hypothetical protein
VYDLTAEELTALEAERPDGSFVVVGEDGARVLFGPDNSRWRIDPVSTAHGLEADTLEVRITISSSSSSSRPGPSPLSVFCLPLN